MWALVQNNEVIELFNTPRIIKVDRTSHPADVFKYWTPEQLKEIGVYIAHPAEEYDRTFYKVNQTKYEFVDDEVQARNILIERDIDYIRRDIILALGMLYRQKQNEGFLYKNVGFDICEKSQFSISMKKASLEKNDETIEWRTYNNQFFTFSARDFQRFYNKAHTHADELRKAKWAHEDAIKIASFEELKIYDMKIGWPTTYEDILTQS